MTMVEGRPFLMFGDRSRWFGCCLVVKVALHQGRGGRIGVPGVMMDWSLEWIPCFFLCTLHYRQEVWILVQLLVLLNSLKHLDLTSQSFWGDPLLSLFFLSLGNIEQFDAISKRHSSWFIRRGLFRLLFRFRLPISVHVHIISLKVNKVLSFLPFLCFAVFIPLLFFTILFLILQFFLLLLLIMFLFSNISPDLFILIGQQCHALLLQHSLQTLGLIYPICKP